MSATGNAIRYFGSARALAPCALPVRAPVPLAFCWSRPAAGEGLVGLGRAAALTAPSPRAALEAVLEERLCWLSEAPPTPGPWFGGFAFDAHRPRSNEWAGFPPAAFFLPAQAIAVSGGQAWALAFCAAPTQGVARDRLASLLEQTQQWAEWAPAGPAGTAAAADGPLLEEDRAGWDALVAAALGEISAGRAEKLVAARRARLAFREPPELGRVLQVLGEQEPGSATFLLRGEDGAAFVGASPETLARWQGPQVQVDALAGTLGEGAGTALDDKLLREHQVVVDGIVKALAALPAQVDAGALPGVRVLRSLRHLHTPIAARLGPGASAADAVATLHPTAAVAGAPCAEALRFLAQKEGFDRGWYAGAVGVVGEGKGQLNVALRSALLAGRGGWAYAGAGLVRGSDAAAEWEETSRKLQTVLSALREAA